jgi:hypothetical protein
MNGKKNANPIDKQQRPSTLLAAVGFRSHTNNKNIRTP